MLAAVSRSVQSGMPTKANELVRLVMEELGVEGPTALARELGMSDYGAPRKIRDWLDGKFSPNYETTVLMLERVGLLDLEAGRRRRALADPSPLSPRQEYLVKAAAEGCPPDALAVIFATPPDQIQTELEAARAELASWQETHDEEEVRGEEETDPAGEPLSGFLSTERLGKAVFALVRSRESHEETGELTLESLERQARANHALVAAVKDEMEAFHAQLQAQLEKPATRRPTHPGKKPDSPSRHRAADAKPAIARPRANRPPGLPTLPRPSRTRRHRPQRGFVEVPAAGGSDTGPGRPDGLMGQLGRKRQ